jgi:hypothetical protein
LLLLSGEEVEMGRLSSWARGVLRSVRERQLNFKRIEPDRISKNAAIRGLREQSQQQEQLSH